MFRLLSVMSLALVLPSCTGQAGKAEPATGSAITIKNGVDSSPPDLTNLYAAAIAEYITKMPNRVADTLYVGRHADFPHIQLPAVISQTNIKEVDGNGAVAYFTGRKNVHYLNIMSWVEYDKAEFLVVTFRDFKPQHNTHLYFKRRDSGFLPDSFVIEYSYEKSKRATTNIE